MPTIGKKKACLFIDVIVVSFAGALPIVVGVLKLADVVVADCLVGLQMLDGNIKLLFIVGEQAIPDRAFVDKRIDRI